MYLQSQIGNKICVKLKHQATKDSTMDMFFDTKKSNGYIINTLVSADEIGIWLEGVFFGTTWDIDEDGKESDHKEEELPSTVMIPWGYVEGVFVVNSSESNPVNIGFKQFNDEE